MKEKYDKENIENSGFTLEEIKQMYSMKNYCMELVSAITQIPIASLSKIIWGTGMNENHIFESEIKRLNRSEFYALRDHDFSVINQDVFGTGGSSIEDDFFDTL